MADRDDIGAYALLAFGVAALWVANKPKPRPKRADRSGESCDPLKESPDGYICVSEDGDFVLRKEQSKFLGYGPYPDRQAVDLVLAQLGMSDLAEFQSFMSQTSRWDLRTDGVIDAATMDALKEAEELFEAGKWRA